MGLARLRPNASVVYLTFWAQLAWVRTTSLEGFDEWLLLSLTSRDIITMPHANRPWQLIMHLLFFEGRATGYIANKSNISIRHLSTASGCTATPSPPSEARGGHRSPTTHSRRW